MQKPSTFRVSSVECLKAWAGLAGTDPLEDTEMKWSVEDSNPCSPRGRPVYSRVQLPLCQRSSRLAPARASAESMGLPGWNRTSDLHLPKMAPFHLAPGRKSFVRAHRKMRAIPAEGLEPPASTSKAWRSTIDLHRSNRDTLCENRTRVLP